MNQADNHDRKMSMHATTYKNAFKCTTKQWSATPFLKVKGKKINRFSAWVNFPATTSQWIVPQSNLISFQLWNGLFEKERKSRSKWFSSNKKFYFEIRSDTWLWFATTSSLLYVNCTTKHSLNFISDFWICFRKRNSGQQAFQAIKCQNDFDTWHWFATAFSLLHVQLYSLQ